MNFNEKLYLFLDIETTGLNFKLDGKQKDNKILEIAYILTNSDTELTPILQGHYVVNRDLNKIEHLMNDYIYELHNANGLINEILFGKGLELDYIDELICNHIKSAIGANHKIIIAGNTVHFDKEMIRRELPSLYSMLHFRNLDVSSIREFINCTKGETAVLQATNKEYKHRALDDIKETIQEMKYYQKLLK